MFASALISTALLVTSSAPSCALVPAFADPPPPQDPLLHGLGAELKEALTKDGWAVKELNRGERDDLCVLGQCPPELAQLAHVPVMIVPRMSKTLDRLKLTIYGEEGPAHSVSRPCHWEQGKVHCDLKNIGQALHRGVPFDEAAVRRAVRAIRPELKACYKGEAPKKLKIQYRARPKGRLSNIRLFGRDSSAGPDACAARRLEALAIPMFTGRPITLQQELRFDKKAKKHKKRRKKGKKKRSRAHS